MPKFAQDKVVHDPKTGQFMPEEGMPTHVNQLTKVGPQLGSNPGGKYQDKHGNAYYVKHSKSNDHAHNEVLAGKLYQAMNAPVMAAHLLDLGEGKKGTITPWVDHEEKFDKDNQDHVREARRHFGAHATLGNWDAIGQEFDNQTKLNGRFHTIDAGGALKYRAQGSPKNPEDFSHEVKEFASMRTGGHPASQVFGPMDDRETRRSAHGVSQVPDATIEHLVHQHALGSPEEKQALAQKLVSRKAHVLSLAGLK